MEKEFHILLQNGLLYKNVKVLISNGYATSNADIYWQLISYHKIFIEYLNETIELKKKDIYHFCISSKY